jgi:hypothetical protein
MSEKYKFRDPLGCYFVTLTTVGWVDVFTRPETKQVVIQSLRHCQKDDKVDKADGGSDILVERIVGLVTLPS